MRRRAVEDLRRRRPSVVDDYGDLHPASLAMIGSGAGRDRPVVRLLLPAGTPAQLFAGMRTALVFAAHLARARDLALELCHFDRPRTGRQKRDLGAMTARITGIAADLVSVRQVWSPGGSHPLDINVATFWETAHALQIAAQVGSVDPSRIVYLVQDYEPEFYPASSASALCRATYHARFTMVVNSTPLLTYLAQREGVQPAPEHVFRPELDLKGIAHAARSRSPSPVVRIAFYGRPGTERNSFELGVAALRLAARRLDSAGIDASFVSMGAAHSDIALPVGIVKALGRLSWQEYFEQMARVDVMVSLQQTPHPSHPPLDAVASGAFAVTNEMGNTRGSLSPRLLAAPSDPSAIADQIVAAARGVQQGLVTAQVDEAFVNGLGRPLEDVVRQVAAFA